MTPISRSRALVTIPLLLLLTLTLFPAFKVDLAKASTTQTNIILNPSFENGLDANGVPLNWSFETCEGVANATASLDSTVSVDGGHSARVYTGPITQTYCIPTNGTRNVGFTQFRQFLAGSVNFTDLMDGPEGFSFWFKLQAYDDQSGMAGFAIRVFGAESTAELDYAFNPDPSLTFVNQTGVGSFLFYGYQPGQWYHFSRNLRADWMGLRLPLNHPFSLVMFEGLVLDSGTTVKSETFWLDDVRAYADVASPNPYLPGVKPGDTWRYGDFVETCQPPCSPGSQPNLNNSIATSTVTNVSGSNVSVSLAFLSNGNTTTTVSTWDLSTGAGRAASITGPPLLIAAGLGQGDHIFNTPSSTTINETVLGVYAGAARQIDVLNFTRSLGSVVYQRATYYDKTTGVLVEDRLAYQGFFSSYKLTETNLWSPSVSYHPGVKVGDSWNFGRPQGFCMSPCPPGFSDFLNSTGVANLITAASGNYVTVKSTIRWANGTTTDTMTTENVETGANITQGSLVVAAGLGPGDRLFNSPSAPTVNFTTTRTYAGVARQVNVLDTTNGFPGNQYHQVSSWDQSTGILTEFQFSAPTASIHFSLVRTNLWSSLPDFSITVFPDLIILPSSPPNNTFIQLPTVTLTSVSNFTGPVELFARVGPPGLTVRFGISNNSTATMLLPPNGTNQTALAPDEFPQPAPGTYFVSITGVSGSLAHSVNATIIVQSPVCGPPPCGFEALSLENYSFNSGTSATLHLRNIGNNTINLLTYYVKDAQGDQYANTAWNGLTISFSMAAPAVFLIGSSCPSCTLSGSAFTFTPGNAYTITVVTSRNNRFTFTVVSGAFTGDFSISANPDLLTFQQPGDPFPKTSAVTLSSLNGFFGNITLTARVVPIVIHIGGNATVMIFPPFQVSVLPPIVSLAPGSVTNATLLVSNAGASPGSYEVNITGTGGGVSHSRIVRIEVKPPPTDFNLFLALTPSSTSVFAGQSSIIGVSLTSVPFGAFFNGTVTLTAQISPSVPNGPVPSFNPAQISFIPPAQSFSTLTTSTTMSTPPGNYTITITGTSGALVHSVQVTLMVLAPPLLTVTPSSGRLGEQITVHGSGFLGTQPPFGFPVQVEITFDDQFIGLVFLTNSSFDFTFNVPHSDPTKLHHIHAVEPFPMSLDVQTDFTVLPEPSLPTPLSISVSTGPIYFPTETVVIYVQISQNGSPTGSSIHLQLIRPDGTIVTLNAASASSGAYKATYIVPRTGSTGTYAIVASTSLNGQNATALGSFEVKTPWLASQSGRTTTTGLALVGIVGLLALVSWKSSWRKLGEESLEERPSSKPDETGSKK